MKVKTFYGTTLQDAMNQAKEELGEDVIVIETKEIKGGGLLLDNRSLIKLTVGVEEKKVGAETAGEVKADKEKDFGSHERSKNEPRLIRRQLDRLFNYFKNITNLGLPDFCERMWFHLTELGMGYADAIELVQDAFYRAGADGSTISKSEFEGYLRRCMVERIKKREGDIGYFKGKKKVVAFLGPSGSGKTATVMNMCLSGLFASFSRKYLITTDVFRIGAAVRLERFAKVAGVSFSRVKDPVELLSCIQKIREGLVLIDTPIGRPKDYKKLYENLKRVEGLFTLVSIPSTMDSFEVEKYLEMLDGLKRIGVVVTKLDEMALPGRVISLVNSFSYPIYFFSDGVEIPESLKVMKSETLVENVFRFI